MSSRAVVMLAICAALVACSEVSQENYAQLKTGMSKADVETLLGKPAECDSAMGVSSCRWGDAQRSISVQYARDIVLTYSGKGLQ
jgi:hypothetical protein